MVPASAAVVGAGLAGCECAVALADAGIPVTLFEMKPLRFSGAHVGADFAELVCSNSFRSEDPYSAAGLLKEEMRALGSLCLQAADATRVPAGKALAVDRRRFAAWMTGRVSAHPGIRVERKEILSLGAPGDPYRDAAPRGYDALIVAAGPLPGEALAASLAALTGEDSLYFYDAVAPIVDGATLNREIVFAASRRNPEDGDYLNCPMNRDEYARFHAALATGRRFPARPFEDEKHFEGCMPVETLAERGFMTLAFGPMKPVGFIDPRTGERPFALLQLRPETLNRDMFNLVGCQTKLAYGEQERVFRLVPGLERAEFARLGSMHRNTFVNAPRVLAEDLSLKSAPGIFLAGQITGVEGYMESAACGLWLGRHLAARARGKTLSPPPQETALGALLGHLRAGNPHFQPSNAQFGLMPALNVKAGKAERKRLYAERARARFRSWKDTYGV
ncbi:MAG: methylenetetrahydrofolate--tRNA-(uracil(54)-C(5))-methyltransferase (FADH(2)-oxidizing) TrmFO [Desulfovibrio sp.]|jgi:methylenetetrahydrofolate--tRNA-(uracil-5-)-methyltransferase|nr:methylenetetrahydrofolate--tRNA-(uracil(54)-C(5))-methyltransferase (FADH(2)-oxidizing) TrmFO [Desulfovibrio sp.]